MSKFLQGSVVAHMARLTLPSIGGMLAIMVFNLTDTWFVSRLGAEPLAAMGFTFPVVMIVGALAMSTCAIVNILAGLYAQYTTRRHPPVEEAAPHAP